MPTIHLVSHTHWDREWYQPFQLFRLRLVHLVDGLLDLLARDPGFKYFMLDGQGIVLDDYLQMRPEREAEIRGHVQSGRLLIGPWFVLPDEFLVSAESIIRNLQWGGRVCERFGPKLACGYLPDTFGHAGQMPQILARYGFESAALWRGAGDYPCEVWWEAPDGSRVFLAHLRRSYSNGSNLPMAGFEGGDPALRDLFVAEMAAKAERMAPHALSGEILVMFGTDHMEPPPGTSAAVAYAQGKLGPWEVAHSTLPAYLEAVGRRLPVIGEQMPVLKGELRNPSMQHLLPGVLSTRMWIKQRNWACETALEKWAEPFAAWAELLAPAAPSGGTAEFPQLARLGHPGEVLRQAWRLLLECHPHDSICGCGVDQTHEEMRPRFDQAEQIADEITRQSLAALAEQVNTRTPREIREMREGGEAGRARGAGEVQAAIVTFNAAGIERSGAVRAIMPARDPLPALVDEYGARVPYQVLGVESREVAYQVLDRNGLVALLAQATQGQVGGMSLVRPPRSQRNGNTLLIEATVSAYAAPLDPVAMAAAWQELQTVLADPSLATFLVRAVTEDMTLELLAEDVPPFGYRTLWLQNPGVQSQEGRQGTAGRAVGHAPDSGAGEEGAGPPAIENEYLRVELSEAGTLTIRDRRTGTVYRGLNCFVDGGDCGDEYNYCPPDDDRIVDCAAAPEPEVAISDRPVSRSLTISYALPVPASLSEDRRSRSADSASIAIRTTLTLTHGVPRVDVVTEVDNAARDHRLRVHFAAPVAVTAADHDGHFEVVRRPLGTPPFDETWEEQPRPERPQRAWTDVSDGDTGLMIAARGLPEVEVLAEGGGSVIALTLLRCVGWLSRDDFATRKGHAGPPLETPGAQMIGRHRFEYSIIPHAGGWAEACDEAYAYVTPLRAAVTGLHAGDLPAAGSLLRHGPPEFQISAIKLPEDGRGLIVRGYNRGDEPIEARLKPRAHFGRAGRAVLDERVLEPLPIGGDGSVTAAAGPHEIVTVRFEIGD